MVVNVSASLRTLPRHETVLPARHQVHNYHRPQHNTTQHNNNNNNNNNNNSTTQASIEIQIQIFIEIVARRLKLNNQHGSACRMFKTVHA